MLQRSEHHSEFRRHNASPTKRNSSIDVANTFTFIDEPLEDSEVLHVQPDTFDDSDPEDAEDRSSPLGAESSGLEHDFHGELGRGQENRPDSAASHTNSSG